MKMRARLLAAGHDQVASGGWAATSVVEVARRAGVSTGALYRHFAGKGELCAEIFRAAAEREVSLMREIAARDGAARERLAACVETFCRRALACGERSGRAAIHMSGSRRRPARNHADALKIVAFAREL